MSKKSIRTYFDIGFHNFDGEYDSLLEDYQERYKLMIEAGGLLSGFQFLIGSIEVGTDDTSQTLIFLLGISFLLSLYLLLSGFIAVEFFRSLKKENPQFVISAIFKYKTYLRSLFFLLPLDITIFIAALLLDVRNKLSNGPFYILIGASIFLVIIYIFWFFKVIILPIRIYTEDGQEIVRRIYTESEKIKLVRNNKVSVVDGEFGGEVGSKRNE